MLYPASPVEPIGFEMILTEASKQGGIRAFDFIESLTRKNGKLIRNVYKDNVYKIAFVDNLEQLKIEPALHSDDGY